MGFPHVPGSANGVECVADVGGELTAYEEPEAGVAEGVILRANFSTAPSSRDIQILRACTVLSAAGFVTPKLSRASTTSRRAR